jgi:hypothetical protein
MRLLGPVVVVATALAGCARPALPDPTDAAREYANAAERGDSEAIYGMLSARARQSFGREGTKRLVAGSRAELQRQGKALNTPGASLETTARVRFADGEQAELVVEKGHFRIASAAALPSGARTPAQALGELRAALARRSYAGLMRALTSEARSALENDLSSLVEGLDQPETLDVKISGDRAEVSVPGGHTVKLKREAGVWRIEDFD